MKNGNSFFDGLNAVRGTLGMSKLNTTSKESTSKKKTSADQPNEATTPEELARLVEYSKSIAGFQDLVKLSEGEFTDDMKSLIDLALSKNPKALEYFNSNADERTCSYKVIQGCVVVLTNGEKRVFIATEPAIALMMKNEGSHMEAALVTVKMRDNEVVGTRVATKDEIEAYHEAKAKK
jgi:hypothetical protein